MPLSYHFSKDEIKRILISTKRIKTLIASNLRKCSQISEELKVIMAEYKDLTSSFGEVSLKYVSHMRNAPSTIYHRRLPKRQRILENCATKYVHINDRLVETCDNLKEIKKSVKVIAKNQTDIVKLQKHLRKLLTSKLKKNMTHINGVSGVKTA